VSPHLRWPGSTIEFPAVWRSASSQWESPDGVYYFDQIEATRATSFFPTYLKHHIGEFAGEPFQLLSYQQLLLTKPLFGWKRSSDGLRRIRKVFAFLPKGAGKSPWGAGTGLYLAFCDGEAGAEVYAVAADKKQARTVHDNARIMVEGMIEAEAEFKDLFTVFRDSIECYETHSKYEVISADAGTKHGFRPHGVIFDELHAQRNRMLYEALKKSMVKRRQPVMAIITHAGYDDEGICYEEYEYAKSVLKGSNTDPSTLPVIFEMTPEDDWTSPEVWRRVNPGHGITVKHDGVATECREAQSEPRKLNDFLMFHGNRWVNQSTAWLPIDWWDACKAPLPTDAELAQLRCVVGVDMSQKIDLTSAVAVFRQPIDGPAKVVEVIETDVLGNQSKRELTLNYRLILIPAFWLPEDTLRERVKGDKVPYDQWHAKGLLRVTDGGMIDSDAVVDYIAKELPARFPLIRQAEVGYDPAFATEVGKDLRDSYGFKAAEVVQGYRSFNEACHVFEALVKSGRIVHGGHRLLRWNVENVAIKRENETGRIRPVKPRNASKRIDGVVAALIGLSVMLDQAPPPEYFVGVYGGRR
jgi:phage terminase large subunit-like protein